MAYSSKSTKDAVQLLLNALTPQELLLFPVILELAEKLNLQRRF